MSKSAARVAAMIALLVIACTTVSPAPSMAQTNCTYTLGYWKNHPSAWPASCLPMNLGLVSYSETDLLAILNQPVDGNGAVALAQQMIAADLNICSGASPTAIASCLQQAQTIFDAYGARKVQPVGNGPYCTSSTCLTGPATQCLDDFNNGLSGPGHCAIATRTTSSTWGQVKTIYR
ncbi:MAG: hypothetical protein HY076_04905 [Candidatus Eisenbacteria bacterium]|uniref:SCP domain-containing protein n=1 Tax=Eiseniibacteriota bacterium TaxID=2212470 RepID=A0A9D6L6B6_UNCEI|nr:hypothetical protein [Candidatus Eisenbacteria bacterium]MBI3539591.1 hypothetical protein [Candidatus Eisenbacteria bacterium]